MKKYIVLENKELDSLLERHQLWLSQNGLRGECLDIKNLDFSNYDLKNKNLSKAKLVGANFNKLNLENINLSGANISKANFSNVTITKSNLRGINAPNANFHNAKIYDSNLRMGNFRTSDFTNSTIIKSFLERATFNQSDLSNSNLSNSNFKMAKFNKAKLINSNLMDTNLVQTNFISANLENADINGAIFWQVQNAYWNITNIKCEYLYIDETGKKRLPASGTFNKGEAEQYLNKIELMGLKQENNSINHNKLEKIIKKHQLFILTDGKEGEKANLSNTDFSEIKLKNKDLKGAILDFCNFNNADLEGANLSGAKLRNTNFDRASLQNINLEGANLSSSTLVKVNLEKSNLKYSKINWSNLENANLKNANLEKSSLINSNLQRINLQNANLAYANLRRSSLSKGNLRGANLTNTYLAKCNLTFVDLSNACLTGATLNSTHTEGWIINNIKCDYIYFDEESKLRTPVHRNFEKGEFEKLYTWFPSFIYYFKDSMHALDPYLISLIISSLNKTIDGLHLDIDEIKAKGLTPQLVLSIKSEHHISEVEQIVKNMLDDNLAILHKKFDNIELSMTNTILPLIENTVKNTIKELPMNKLEFNAPVGMVIAENNGIINIKNIIKNEIVKIKEELKNKKVSKTFTQKMKDSMLSELSKAAVGEVSEISQNTIEWMKKNASDFSISISDFLDKIS